MNEETKKEMYLLLNDIWLALDCQKTNCHKTEGYDKINEMRVLIDKQSGIEEEPNPSDDFGNSMLNMSTKANTLISQLPDESVKPEVDKIKDLNECPKCKTARHTYRSVLSSDTLTCKNCHTDYVQLRDYIGYKVYNPEEGVVRYEYTYFIDKPEISIDAEVK